MYPNFICCSKAEYLNQQVKSSTSEVEQLVRKIKVNTQNHVEKIDKLKTEHANKLSAIDKSVRKIIDSKDREITELKSKLQQSQLKLRQSHDLLTEINAGISLRR